MSDLSTVDAMSTTAPTLSPADRAAHEAASYVRPAARRVTAVGVIGRTSGRTVTTVRTADGVTGTVTAAVR